DSGAQSYVSAGVGGKLQIVPGVRLVERLVAEGEVRDDVVGEGAGERGPVEERRIDDLDPVQAAPVFGHDCVHDAAPPGFDDAEGRLVGFDGAEGDGERAGR